MLNPLIVEHRELVDSLAKILDRISEINESLDEEHKTDMCVCVGQHRHAFEEQGVTDHQDCVVICKLSGTPEGVTGGLMLMSDKDPAFKKCILLTAKYILNA